jgi:hypothetical protein
MIEGHVRAPEQYRIGVFFPAYFVSQLSHGRIPVRGVLAVFDGVFLAVTLWIVFSLLAKQRVYLRLSDSGRLAANLLGFALTLFYLSWLFEYHKFETVANSTCIAIIGAILAGRHKLPVPLSVAALLLVSAYFATIRADSAIACNLGIGLIALIPGKRVLPLGRVPQIVTALAGAVTVLGVEYYITHIMFPNRPYPGSRFLLLHNLTTPISIFVVVVALGPWFLTVRLAQRFWSTLEAWECALIFASITEFLIYFVVAQSGEVRLFLPYPMALVPVSVVLMLRFLFHATGGADQAVLATGEAQA